MLLTIFLALVFCVAIITTLCDQPTTGEDCFFTVLRFDL